MCINYYDDDLYDDEDFDNYSESFHYQMIQQLWKEHEEEST